MADESASSVFAVMTSWFTPSFLFVFLNLMIGTIALISSFATQKKRQHQQQQQPAEGYPPPPLVRVPSLLERVRSFDFSFYGYEQPHLSPPEATFQPRDSADLDTPPQLVRVPSLLERVKHFNFSLYGAELPNPSSPETTLQPRESVDVDPPPQLVRAPSLLDRLRSFNLSLYKYEQPDQSPPETVFRLADPAGEASDQSPSHGQDHQVRRSKSETKPASGSVRKRQPEQMKKSASSNLSVSRNFEEEEELDSRRPETARESRTRAKETALFGDDEEVDAKADDFINRFKQQLKLQRLDSLLRYKEMLTRGSGK